LTTDAAIRKLNRQFRGKNTATDILSFPAEGIGAEEIAGDLAISVPIARRQAFEQGHSLSTEIKVLILHGLLHLAGYDHEADEGKMARRERRLRAGLGLPQGLIERAVMPEPATHKIPKMCASGAKARVDFGRVNVRAKARTLHLKPVSARLKPRPDTRQRSSGAEARVDSKPTFRGLKAPAPSDKDFEFVRGAKP
jgi:probable rRNA maturation factor